MAKLQGHFLKYRHDPEEAVANATDLTQDLKTLGEMTIIEWLRRLNLDHYAENFTRRKVFFVGDLHLFQDEGSLASLFGISDQMDLKRANAMINDREDAKIANDFALLSV